METGTRTTHLSSFRQPLSQIAQLDSSRKYNLQSAALLGALQSSVYSAHYTRKSDVVRCYDLQTQWQRSGYEVYRLWYVYCL